MHHLQPFLIHSVTAVTITITITALATFSAILWGQMWFVLFHKQCFWPLALTMFMSCHCENRCMMPTTKAWYQTSQLLPTTKEQNHGGKDPQNLPACLSTSSSLLRCLINHWPCLSQFISLVHALKWHRQPVAGIVNARLSAKTCLFFWTFYDICCSSDTNEILSVKGPA